ncbi:MAG: O-methyltransferase family 2 [Myxococcales bacterium]|nr:O-methyltransferase family 2 [Myxococcales bacterium]
MITTQHSGAPADVQPLVSLALSFWGAKAAMTAVDLGVFGELARGPREEKELATALGFAGRGARDFFDALVAIGLLERRGQTYANTPMAEQYLDPSKPSYIGGVFEMTNQRLYPVWCELAVALQTGLPRNEAKDENDYYANLGRSSDRLAVFLRGMTGLSAAASRAIAEQAPWGDYRTFLDVGGAEGGLAVRIASAHPHLTGGCFELPGVAGYFDAYVARFGLSDRLQFHGGDFFEDPLPKADVIVMGHVLHNWNLDQKRALVRKAYAALPPGGMLLVHECLIDDERKQNAFGLLMSLNMLLVTREGFGFTGAECQAWMWEAGFGKTRVEHLCGSEWMVVAIK